MQPKSLTTTNDKRHADIVRRTKSAIDELLAAGESISFYAVAAKAQVSRSTLYRSNDLRRLVENARSESAAQLKGQSENPACRIAELEAKLASITHERDELKRLIRNTRMTHYAFVQIPEMA